MPTSGSGNKTPGPPKACTANPGLVKTAIMSCGIKGCRILINSGITWWWARAREGITMDCRNPLRSLSSCEAWGGGGASFPVANKVPLQRHQGQAGQRGGAACTPSPPSPLLLPCSPSPNPTPNFQAGEVNGGNQQTFLGAPSSPGLARPEWAQIMGPDVCRWGQKGSPAEPGDPPATRPIGRRLYFLLGSTISTPESPRAS